MPEEREEKVARVNISLRPSIWYRFRMGCLAHHVSASSVIEQLISEQLKTWAREDHHPPQTSLGEQAGPPKQ